MTEILRKKLARLVAMFNTPSSWRGLIVVLTGFGVGLKPEHANAIMSGGLILAGAIGIWLEP
jgi:hypothetical protein